MHQVDLVCKMLSAIMRHLNILKNIFLLESNLFGPELFTFHSDFIALTVVVSEDEIYPSCAAKLHIHSLNSQPLFWGRSLLFGVRDYYNH